MYRYTRIYFSDWLCLPIKYLLYDALIIFLGFHDIFVLYNILGYNVDSWFEYTSPSTSICVHIGSLI